MNADSARRIARVAGSPNLLARGLNRLYHRRLGLRTANSAGVDVFAEDWDNLLVLDACRYDMFAEHAELPGRLERRTSRGSSTTEWLRANLDGRTLLDTVYVTANPQLYRNRDSIDVQFHDVVHVWREDGWDDDEGTILPETVTTYAQDALETYPRKRLLIHYMQPHYPFIGSDAEGTKDHLARGDPEVRNVWDRLMEGRLDRDPAEIWEPYVSNLACAVPHVREFCREADGLTVVTADHGNMVGERAAPVPVREWGHPRGLYVDELVTVPWLVVEGGQRRTVRAEAPQGTVASVDREVVDDRLRQLGYVT